MRWWKTLRTWVARTESRRALAYLQGHGLSLGQRQRAQVHMVLHCKAQPFMLFQMALPWYPLQGKLSAIDADSKHDARDRLSCMS